MTTFLACFLTACGSTAGTPGIAEKGVVDKTGSGGVLDKTGAGTASKAAAGTKKLPGSVCSLLTPAEAEAVVKIGTPMVPTEAKPEPDTDRSCLYVVAGAAPEVALTVQGEREPLDLSSFRSYPTAKISKLNGGAEAIYLPGTAVVYVAKNGLAVTVQVVVPPEGETAETAELKLAQTIANRLP